MKKNIHKRQVQPSNKNIASVIITYNPEGDFNNRLDLITSQVAHTIIVDNSNSAVAYNILEQSESLNVEVIRNTSNLGIAKALNQGVQRAIELGFSWVLTFDQDTVVDLDMVKCLMSIYSHCDFKGSIGIISPNARSKFSGRLYIDCQNANKDFIELKTVVTSGSMMSVDAYEHVGPFRDDFFIEGVDLEYCLRLHKYGYKVLLSSLPLMTHGAGKMEEHSFLGRTVLVPNHLPWRYYYMIRNLIIISRSYFFQEIAWISRAILNSFKMAIKILLFEDKKWAKFYYMSIGVFDAFFKPNHNRFYP